MAADNDTIAAVATPPGRGGIGVVRVSGPQAPAIAAAILGALPAPRAAVRRSFRGADGDALDAGLALFFAAPASFTGEDVLELHGHGGPVVLDLVLARVLSLGARLARPGEFTLRAFLNDKIDLAQAEAVADLVDSASRGAARAAMRSLEGALSARATDLVERLVAVRVHVEAAIDFPEEEIDFLADETLAAGLADLEAALAATRAEAERGRLLREGITVAIAGRANVGKSSLLNRLAREEAAIVTAVPGTTRDVVERRVAIAGMPVRVLDTAGLRETVDVVERIGVDRARGAIRDADVVILVVDDARGFEPEDAAIRASLPADPRWVLVRNKIDLSGRAPGVEEPASGPEVALSALTGAGLDGLERCLAGLVGADADGAAFSARRRHLDALDTALAATSRAREALRRERAGELAAEELRRAQQALAEITGEFGSEDLLGRIFSEFCIGK